MAAVLDWYRKYLGGTLTQEEFAQDLQKAIISIKED